MFGSGSMIPVVKDYLTSEMGANWLFFNEETFKS